MTERDRDPVESDLEHEIHRALRALPPPRAPRSLAPRIMASIKSDGSMDRWVDGSMAWRSWPLHWQLLSLVGACSLIIAVAFAVSRAQSWVAGLTATRAVVGLWQTCFEPVAMPLVILTAVMCTACALIVAALKHVAWEGREISH